METTEHAARVPVEVHLDEWNTTADPYHAPELGKVYLSGLATGHPRYPERHAVTTSRIVGVLADDPKVVVTRSGRRYRLGEPKADWLAWLAERGIEFNPERPVRAPLVTL